MKMVHLRLKHCIYSAFVWNAGAMISVVYAPVSYVFVSFILIIGLLTAEAMSLSSIFNAYLFYFLLMLLPQLVMMYRYADPAHNGE